MISNIIEKSIEEYVDRPKFDVPNDIKRMTSNPSTYLSLLEDSIRY
ncbi:MAG: hypothetical protein QXN14_06880 [Ignisphaera sp.]